VRYDVRILSPGAPMPATDPRVDAYLLKAPPYARPILTEVRARLHALLPLSETIKWRVPFFLLGGRIFASMAAFKAHTTINLWKADFHSGMPQGFKASAVSDLPAKGEFAKRVKASAATFGPATVAKTKKAAAKRKTPARKR
jgi:hypothetical protein